MVRCAHVPRRLIAAAASKHNKARSACVASARDRLEASDARARTQLDALAATQTELVTRRMAELEANTRAQEELYQRMAAVSADFMVRLPRRRD